VTTGDVPEPDDASTDPSRRTQFAQERTLLAWWRTGIAAAAVSLAVGGLIPKLGDLPRGRFLALGVGYGILALMFFVGGAIRGRLSRQALARNSFAALPEWAVVILAVYMSALVVLSMIALI
jgi:putative membrane protein